MMLVKDLRKLLARIPESEDNAPVLIDSAVLENWEINARCFLTHKVTGALAHIHPLHNDIDAKNTFIPSIRNVLWLKPHDAVPQHIQVDRTLPPPIWDVDVKIEIAP